MRVPTRRLRVLIADDHPLIRRSFRQDLEAVGIDVCAEAITGAEAVRAALAERPDLCLLDVRMPEGGGINAAEAIRDRLPVAVAPPGPTCAPAIQALRNLSGRGPCGAHVVAKALTRHLKARSSGDW
jgi:CheY-like chemotaxis protein